MGSHERADSLVEQGIELYSQGDLESAIHRWRAALELDRGHAKARQYLGYVQKNRAALEDRIRGTAGPDDDHLDVVDEVDIGEVHDALGRHDQKTSHINADVLATWLEESRKAGVLGVEEGSESDESTPLPIMGDLPNEGDSQEVPLSVMPEGGEGTRPSDSSPGEATPAGARQGEPGWDDLDLEGGDEEVDDDAFDLDYAQFEVIDEDEDAGEAHGAGDADRLHPDGAGVAVELDLGVGDGPSTDSGPGAAGGGDLELDLEMESLELELGAAEGEVEEVELPSEADGIRAPSGVSGSELDFRELNGAGADDLGDLPPLDLGGEDEPKAPEVDVEVGEVDLDLSPGEEGPGESDQADDGVEGGGFSAELAKALTPTSDSIPDLPSIPRTGAFDGGGTPASAWFPDHVQPMSPGGDADESPLTWETAEKATPDAAPLVNAGPATATRLLAEAERLAANDELEEALRICEDLLRREPGDGMAMGLAVKMKERLTEAYVQEIGDLSVVPTVSAPRHELVWQKLDHRAGFLLSRVDGLLTFEDVIDISGMDEYEATRTLCGLLREGVIRQK